jgi:hypothetical protein
MKPTSAQLRLLTDDDLDHEFTSADHDEPTRTVLLYEKLRRLSRPSSSARSWIQWTTLALALASAILAGIAAWPVIANFGEKEWFDF